MWFKRVLLGYCATSWAVIIVTAAFSKDATLSKRHHEVERLTFPSLERRQLPVGNHTSSTGMIVPTPHEVISSASTPQPSEIFQTSTDAATSLTASSLELAPSSSLLFTRSETGPPSASATPSGNSADVPSTILQSTESTISTTSTTPSSLTIEQQTSQTLSTILPSLSQDVTSSKALDITSIAKSSTELAQTSSGVDTASTSILQSTFMSNSASDTVPSSTLTPSASMSLTSAPVEGNSQTDFSTTLAIADVSSVTSAEVGSSTAIAPSSPSLAPESSSEVPSTPVLAAQTSAASAASVEQQSSSFISSSVEGASIPTPSPTDSATSSGAHASTPSSPTSSVTEFQTSSSTAPELSTPDASSIVQSSSSVTTSEAVSSMPMSSALESSLTSSVGAATSTIEESQPVPSSSFLATSTTFISATGQTSSLSAEATSTAVNVPSSITDQISVVTLSSTAMDLASSTQAEQSQSSGNLASLWSPASSMLSSPVSSLTDSETGTHPPAPTSSSGSTTTPLPQLPSETATSVFSLPDSSAIVSVSIAPALSTSTLGPLPTSLETGASIMPSSDIATSSFGSATTFHTNSFETSTSSGGITGSEGSPSIMPSETLVSSVFSYLVFSTSTSYVSPSTTTSFATQNRSSGTFSATSASEELSSDVVTASESQIIISQAPLGPSLAYSSSAPLSASSAPAVSVNETLSAQPPTSTVVPSTLSSTDGAIPTLETAGVSLDTTSSSAHTPLSTETFSSSLSFAPSGALASQSTINTPLPSSVRSNFTQTISSSPTVSGTITATFSTVYVSTARSSTLDLSGVTFSLLSSVTEAGSNQTKTSSSGLYVPASESTTASIILTSGANSTWASPLHPSLTTTASSSGRPNSTRTGTAELGITLSRSAVPTGTTSGTVPFTNVTQAETLQTSSAPVALNSTTAGVPASIISKDITSARSNTESATSTYNPDEASTTDGSGTERMKTSTTPQAPTSTPTQTMATGSPPPLTTSQTAGVAVGATTGLLIAVVAAIFVARRYHAAKHSKHMSTGSIYPKVAYLYDPKTGGDSGDAEALMSGATGGPGGPSNGAAQGSPNHVQRHSTGTTPLTRFTSPRNPFTETTRDPAVHRYSQYARIDTARALSAAIAGYGGTAKHSSSYTKYPSNVTNPFSDHVIPSPTFAPFSPDDIRRPELKKPHNLDDGRGEYSQIHVNPYAYLNTAASMYPPVSPYGRPSTQIPSSSYDGRRQTIDSDPFADPFEHDLILHVAEQNRTSDSVTVFAPSPNLISPRTPRTPVGPKLPVRQPNGLTSARSLLSPVAAKYLHEAQEVRLPHVASPVLVQVGRSPVIKPFFPPPAAPEPLGWDDIKRNSEKHFSDEKSVPAPLKFPSLAIKKKPVPASHTRMNPSLTGAGQALLAGNGLPLTVKIPHRYSKSVGLDVPRARGRPHLVHEEVSKDPVVREKRSRELRFANPALVGKDF